MTNLFWSRRNDTMLGAINEISRATDDANIAAAGASIQPSQPRDWNETNERLEQLLLVCAAMWELLSEKTNLTENDLITRIAELDARDGVADGKLTYTPVKCPKCQRTIFPKQRRCLYCGAERVIDSVFKTI